MMINVSLSWMEQFISSVFGLDRTFLFLPNGLPFPGYPATAGLLEEDGTLSDRLFSGNEDYIIKDIGGEKCIIFGAKNAQLGWRFVRVVKYAECLSAFAETEPHYPHGLYGGHIRRNIHLPFQKAVRASGNAS